MAVRQLDPLSEFLCYYRVIEAVARNNGKHWIEGHLPTVSSANLGRLEVIEDGAGGKNAFVSFKRRALSRLKSLRSSGRSDKAIADYFYDIRNTLAHGARSVRTSSLGPGVEQLARDTMVMKVLARIAIESKLVR